MFWFFAPVVWIMQARMMAVLKRNIERVERPGGVNRPGIDGGSGYWFPTPMGSACCAA